MARNSHRLCVVVTQVFKKLDPIKKMFARFMWSISKIIVLLTSHHKKAWKLCSITWYFLAWVISWPTLILFKILRKWGANCSIRERRLKHIICNNHTFLTTGSRYGPTAHHLCEEMSFFAVLIHHFLLTTDSRALFKRNGVKKITW